MPDLIKRLCQWPFANGTTVKITDAVCAYSRAPAGMHSRTVSDWKNDLIIILFFPWLVLGDWFPLDHCVASQPLVPAQV